VRFLVLDAYPREGRAALREAGGTPAGELYARLLRAQPAGTVQTRIDVAHPADPQPVFERGVQIGDYDGVVWTGSSLTIHHGDDPRVRRQVELARAIFGEGVPSFGSCWAAQVAVVAAGGDCAANPKGREFGISRRIRLGTEGREHPLYRDKPRVFDAFTSHADEIVRLPPRARLLASNDFSRVQAVEVSHERGVFWAVQYHPEYDLAEVAALCRLRQDELVDQGSFESHAHARTFIAQLEALHRDPSRRDLIEALDLGAPLLDPAQRTLELRNWIDHQVRGDRSRPPAARPRR
jgi:GMP synthase (glutamine-hydrolysing)